MQDVVEQEEYDIEKIRLRNLQENAAFLQDLGFKVSMTIENTIMVLVCPLNETHGCATHKYDSNNGHLSTDSITHMYVGDFH